MIVIDRPNRSISMASRPWLHNTTDISALLKQVKIEKFDTE
jgi:hypothetical protein